MKFRETIDKKSGITLIALVITIIVLLILAGTSIAMLTGNNGILTQAIKAKELTQVTTEKEAIELMVTLANMNNKLNQSEYYIGTPLYDRTQENGDKWNVISMNDTKKTYGTGWNYICKETEIQEYGKLQYSWIVNYSTGDVIKLEDGEYINLDYSSSLAVTDNIILNIDPSNMSDNTSWGNNVRLIGVTDGDGYGWQGTAIKLDGINDYIEVYSNDFEITEGITFEFYGNSAATQLSLLGKTIVGDETNAYSKRFRVRYRNNDFVACMGSTDSGSTWSMGGTSKHWIQYNVGKNFNAENGNYLTMSVNIKSNKIALYWNGEFLGETECSHDWLVGGELTNSQTPFTIGMIVQGESYTESYSKMDIYACRLYNKCLNESQVLENYNKTVLYHNLENNE